MTEAKPSDVMKKLVLFIIGIAILGTIIALAVYFSVNLPAQNNIKAPTNANLHEAFYACLNKCSDDCNSCIRGCYQFPENSNERQECKNKCPCDANKDCKQCNSLY